MCPAAQGVLQEGAGTPGEEEGEVAEEEEGEEGEVEVEEEEEATEMTLRTTRRKTAEYAYILLFCVIL